MLCLHIYGSYTLYRGEGCIVEKHMNVMLAGHTHRGHLVAACRNVGCPHFSIGFTRNSMVAVVPALGDRVRRTSHLMIVVALWISQFINNIINHVCIAV
jgi:hypothetical protein